jgi:hypothetical protein
MIPYLKYHNAFKEAHAEVMFDCKYDDLTEKGQMIIDDRVADEWLKLREVWLSED